jgi:beta-lactam-binding protein with PASTA domain
VNIVKSGISALGRLLILAGLAVAFLFGLVSVVYMSLQGREVKVPELTGKDYSESERELSLLGLKVKRRADRASTEKPNTILEQLPHPGDTVKTGQMILVVTAKPGEAGEAPTTIKKTGDEDDTEKIEEMITDKPKKKANTNSNKKKPDTTRDVNGSASNSISDSNTSETDSNKKEPSSNNSGDKGNKNSATPGKPDKPAANKSVIIKPTSGETRPKTVAKPQ